MIYQDILLEWLNRNASDIIIPTASFPSLKVDWEIVYLENFPKIDKETFDREILISLTDMQKEALYKNKELDFSIEMKWYSRFRVNAFSQKNWFTFVLRPIKNELPEFANLGIPKTVLSFANRRNGLVLVTWWVWSWKSTTLASLLSHINKTRKKHIITVEDPIEFVYTNEKSLIEQREVWVNTDSFENWLKYALRQASDVIMIWEMRDLETFRLALRAAETWNLVFATLHTSWAARTVARIIDMYPSDERDQIKQQLSESLIWVVWQDLLKKSTWEGRVLAVEILVNNTWIQNMIRKGNTHQIDWAIETWAQEWMITMNKFLEYLYSNKLISEDIYKSNLRYNQ